MKVAPVSADLLIKLALGVGAVGLLWYVASKAKSAVGDTLTQAQALAIGAVQAANPVNVVTNIGEAVGVPKTDTDECARAMAEGRTWDASFACPASTFLKYSFSGAPGSGEQAMPSPYIDTSNIGLF